MLNQAALDSRLRGNERTRGGISSKNYTLGVIAL
jgi:hypothetical protein